MISAGVYLGTMARDWTVALMRASQMIKAEKAHRAQMVGKNLEDAIRRPDIRR